MDRLALTLVALLATTPTLAEDAPSAPATLAEPKVAAAPAKPAAPAPAGRPAPVLELAVPMKDQELGGMDRLLEKRMAEKRLPKAAADIGLREVPKKKDATQDAQPAAGQY